jgi:Spy/CpxP family protein refolding chaperone
MIGIALKHLHARRTLLMAGVLAVGCCALWAQPDGPPPDGPPPGAMQPDRGPSVDKELKQLTQALALTPDQQTQVKAILTDQHEQIKALITQQSKAVAADNDPQANMDAFAKVRAAVDAIREDAHAKIAAALTDDQKTKFAAWEKKQKKSSSQPPWGDMPPPPPDGGGGPPGV